MNQNYEASSNILCHSSFKVRKALKGPRGGGGRGGGRRKKEQICAKRDISMRLCMPIATELLLADHLLQCPCSHLCMAIISHHQTSYAAGNVLCTVMLLATYIFSKVLTINIVGQMDNSRDHRCCEQSTQSMLQAMCFAP